MTSEDLVWDRALQDPAPPDAREGDVALRDLLAFHGAAMNGGPLHAWEVVGEAGTRAALAGYRRFGLAEAAASVEWLLAETDGADLDDLDVAERLEREGDERYYGAVPDDGVLSAAFARVYADDPEAFAPVR